MKAINKVLLTFCVIAIGLSSYAFDIKWQGRDIETKKEKNNIVTTKTTTIDDSSTSLKKENQKEKELAQNVQKINEIAQADVDFEPYIKRVQKRIKSNWHPPKYSTSNRIILHFTILKNGELSNCKILKSSNDDIADSMAIKAVENSAPFEPLPINFKGDSADIKFTFDYNVYDNITPRKIESLPNNSFKNNNYENNNYYNNIKNHMDLKEEYL